MGRETVYTRSMRAPFLWGAATSAHQVEGNNVRNDWWAWEQAQAPRLRSGLACDHYRRYREDFVLARALGHTAHRLSVEWSRIEPTQGRWDETALAHYRAVLEELRRQRLVSFVTLHHFTNPLWFAQRGGWERADAAELFARYARVLAQQLGELVDFWVTINEPVVYAQHGWWHGRWIPQRRSAWATLRVLRHLAAAHRKAYRVIHTLFVHARVGLAQHFIAYLPHDPHCLADRLSVAIGDWWFNRYFLRLTAATHDYLGVNYYFTETRRGVLFPPFSQSIQWRGAVSDLQWPLRPEGLTLVLEHLKHYGLPIYITENGLADAADSKRADFLREHLRAVEQAQAGGADVRGYLHWSLLDNFEWDLGFAPRFGLVKVDYTTMERTVRPSAYVYKAIIEQAKKV